MAKPQKKKVSRPSWFQKQIERGGENFLHKKPPHEIERDGLNILRDIARGNIKQNELRYLFNSNVLSNMEKAVNYKRMETQIYFSSLSIVKENPQLAMLFENSYGMIFNKVFNDTQVLLNAYNIAIQHIVFMRSLLQTSYPNEQIRDTAYYNAYYNAQLQLSQFKHII